MKRITGGRHIAFALAAATALCLAGCGGGCSPKSGANGGTGGVKTATLKEFLDSGPQIAVRLMYDPDDDERGIGKNNRIYAIYLFENGTVYDVFETDEFGSKIEVNDGLGEFAKKSAEERLEFARKNKRLKQKYNASFMSFDKSLEGLSVPLPEDEAVWQAAGIRFNDSCFRVYGDEYKDIPYKDIPATSENLTGLVKEGILSAYENHLASYPYMKNFPNDRIYYNVAMSAGTTVTVASDGGNVEQRLEIHYNSDGTVSWNIYETSGKFPGVKLPGFKVETIKYADDKTVGGKYDLRVFADGGKKAKREVIEVPEASAFAFDADEAEYLVFPVDPTVRNIPVYDSDNAPVQGVNLSVISSDGSIEALAFLTEGDFDIVLDGVNTKGVEVD